MIYDALKTGPTVFTAGVFSLTTELHNEKMNIVGFESTTVVISCFVS